MGFLDAFVAAAIAAVVGMYIKKKCQEVHFVKSGVDGNRYLVRRAEDEDEAADTLARINGNIERLKKRLRATHPEDARTELLDTRYNRDALSEGGHDVGYTSYSVNKGESIVMCLRARGGDEDNGEIEKFNTLMYVVLHEISHLVTEEIGHTKAFWTNFKWILDNAAEEGIYTAVDYAQEPEQYCGININSSVANRKN